MTSPLDNVTPVNEQKPEDETETQETQTSPETQEPNGPPPSNKERQEAKAAKEAKEAEEAEKAKASEEEKAADDDDENKELDTEVWGDLGDEVANSVLQTLQNSGVTTEDAKALLWDAIEAGDPSKIDRDALVEKVGKAKATLIMAGVENYTAKNNAKLAEVQKIANDAAGGEQNWQKAVAWAKEKLTDHEVGELRNMLDKGGRQATFAANEIVSRYNDAPENTSLTAGKGQVTPDGKNTTKVEGITRRQYGEELQKLQRKGATNAEFNALRAKREAGKKQGI